MSVLKLAKNEVLHTILGLFCKKVKIQDGRRRPFGIYAKNKHIKEENQTLPLHQILL